MTRTNQHDAPVAEYDVLTLVAKSLTTQSQSVTGTRTIRGVGT